MTAWTSTAEVTAARIIHANGMQTRLYTATCTASDTYDASGEFEAIYYVRGWDEADGTDAECFCTSAAYGTEVTNTQNKGDILCEITGIAVKSTGGST